MTFQFTRADFLREFSAFRALMGSKSFWDKAAPDRDQAVKGFSFVYVNADILPEDQTTFESTIQEYNQRETMLIRYQLTHLRERP